MYDYDIIHKYAEARVSAKFKKKSPYDQYSKYRDQIITCHIKNGRDIPKTVEQMIQSIPMCYAGKLHRFQIVDDFVNDKLSIVMSLSLFSRRSRIVHAGKYKVGISQ